MRYKGTAEKKFKPLYVDGQSASDFEERAWYNMTVARDGDVFEPKYMKARGVKWSFIVLKRLEAIIQNNPEDPAIEGRKAVILRARAYIDKYFEDALQRSDATGFRLLAEVLEHPEPSSSDALRLIEFCRTKPHVYTFTFKELRGKFAACMNVKPPFDEAFEKRLRRLIKIFGIRIR